jgi:hypothetical protein
VISGLRLHLVMVFKHDLRSSQASTYAFEAPIRNILLYQGSQGLRGLAKFFYLALDSATGGTRPLAVSTSVIAATYRWLLWPLEMESTKVHYSGLVFILRYRSVSAPQALCTNHKDATAIVQRSE